ncbi:hypothetical protein V512_011385 [Mesotoga sp. Brook.08.105.5.1]|nr:hypothetical protein V512_011385 [Mesotoga sp. Brook.08.105.5.1]
MLLVSWQCMLYLAPDDPDLKSFLGKSGKRREEEREREGERTRKTVQTSGARQSLFSLLVFSWFLTTISVCGGSLSLFSEDGGPVDGHRCFEQRTAGSPLLSVQRNFQRSAGSRS